MTCVNAPSKPSSREASRRLRLGLLCPWRSLLAKACFVVNFSGDRDLRVSGGLGPPVGADSIDSQAPRKLGDDVHALPLSEEESTSFGFDLRPKRRQGLKEKLDAKR
jgi:hypothetical protein